MNFPIDFGYIKFSADFVADFIFFVVVAIVGVISVILSFHWKRYGLSNKVFAFVELIYLTVCVFLLLIAFFSIN